jgi:hypothetical protein
VGRVVRGSGIAKPTRNVRDNRLLIVGAEAIAPICTQAHNPYASSAEPIHCFGMAAGRTLYGLASREELSLW